MMRKKWLSISLVCGVFLGIALKVPAQRVNTDSLKLVSKISADQLKLGNLQNEIGSKTREKQDAAEKAQRSANENTNAATKLSSNPQDKKYARQADNAASEARKDAKRARKASERLDDLNKNIQDLQGKIAGEQNKLMKYTGAVPAAVSPAVQVPVMAPAQSDTTQHR